MKTVYICWVDDSEIFIPSLSDQIELLQGDQKMTFVIDPHYDTDNIDTIARSLTEDSDLIFLIDYNLKKSDGSGMDGDSVIKLIRDNNAKCIIVFYSSKASQEELRSLVNGLPNIIVEIRESMSGVLTEIAKGEISNRIPKK